MDSTSEPAVPEGVDVHVLAEAQRRADEPRAALQPHEPQDHHHRIRRSRKKGLARFLELTVRFLKTGSIHRKSGYLRPKL